MKSNTIDISDDANRNIEMLMAQKDLTLSEAIEVLAKLIPMMQVPETNKIDAKLSSIQINAFNIMEYTQEIKEGDLLPHEAYYDYVMECLGLIEDDLEETGRLVGEVDTQT